MATLHRPRFNVVYRFLVSGNVNMTSKQRMLEIYPNFLNRELPYLLGCVSEHAINDAKNFFLRCCYKDVTIHKVVPWKRNCQPSCAWKVFYKLKDQTPNFVEAGQTVEDFIIPFQDDDEELKKIFHYITTMTVGMSAVQKGYTYDKVYAIVDYVPICCICPVKDFNETAKLIPCMHNLMIS